MRDSFLLAKVILLSVLVTLLVSAAAVYIFRSLITDYLVAVVTDAAASEAATVDDPVIEAVAKVNPAVVSVVVTKDVPIYEQYFETINPWGFWGGISVPRLRENGSEEREVGGGTGFVVREDGLIVTNHHVVADQTARYSVVMYDGTSYAVDVIDSDPEIDIAIVAISEPLTAPLATARFGDASTLRAGQTVIAIGNALAEFQNSVSVGVVSGLARNIVASDSAGMSEELYRVIQTDAAINPGNSGGPLLNVAGEVVGVNVATSRGADNIGFAIPSDMVQLAVTSVIEHGEIIRPFLGVRYVTITERFANVQNLPVSYGALVVEGEAGEMAIGPDSPADRLGLQPGDIIVAIDGVSLERTELGEVLRTLPVEIPLSIEYLREGTYVVDEVQLDKS